MKFTLRLSVVIAGIFVATALAGPLAKLAIDAFVEDYPRLSETLRLHYADGVYDFGRVFRRLFMLVALAGLLLTRRWMGSVPMRGLRANEGRWRMLGAGLLLGLASMLLFVLVLLLVGQRVPVLVWFDGWQGAVALALLAAVLISTVEELALRGYVLGGQLGDMPVFVAVLTNSAFYSALHFLKTEVRVAPGPDPAIGFEALAAHLAPLGTRDVLLPFVGLLLVGFVLAYAYLWTRSLPFVIGLHTGWVFVLSVDGMLLLKDAGARDLYGPDGMLASPWVWAFLLVMLGLLWSGLKRGKGRADAGGPFAPAHH